MEEHEIEIRPVRQFYAAELAVSDNTESGNPAGLAIAVTWLTVLLDEIGISQFQCFFQNQFREVGQAVADFHDLQLAAEIGDRNAKQTCPLKLSERLYEMLAVHLVKTGDTLIQFLCHFACRKRSRKQARVE